jgi:hypothetical protein
MNAVSGSSVSMSSASNKNVIKTYPNPNMGAFKVQLQNLTSSKAEVAVFDARGTSLQRRVFNPSTNTIADFDLKGKAKGLYYLKVMSDEGMKVIKVVIQ